MARSSLSHWPKFYIRRQDNYSVMHIRETFGDDLKVNVQLGSQRMC